MKDTQIVWNGVDSYIDVNSGAARDYNITRHADGSASLFTNREEFTSVAVIEIDKATIPTDEDGELILNSLYVTGDFRFFRAKGE